MSDSELFERMKAAVAKTLAERKAKILALTPGWDQRCCFCGGISVSPYCLQCTDIMNYPRGGRSE